MAVAQYFLALLVGLFAQAAAQGRGRVSLVIGRFPQTQQAAFLGGEQKDQTHHDRQGRLVELRGRDARQQRAGSGVTVQAIQRTQELRDGPAHLQAQLVRDGLLGISTFFQQAGQGLGLGQRKEAPPVQQGHEGTQGDALFQPDVRLPGYEGGGLVLTGMHQHELAAIAHQPQRHARGPAEFGHAARRAPGTTASRQGGIQTGRGDAHQQNRAALRSRGRGGIQSVRIIQINGRGRQQQPVRP